MPYKNDNDDTQENRLVTMYELSKLCGLSIHTLKKYSQYGHIKKVCIKKKVAYYNLEESIKAIREKRENPKSRCYTKAKHTLCETCNNTGSACPWMKEHKPVPGWTAEQIDVEGKVSYLVKECPMYEYEYYLDENGVKRKKTPPMQWLKDLREGRMFDELS